MFKIKLTNYPSSDKLIEASTFVYGDDKTKKINAQNMSKSMFDLFSKNENAPDLFFDFLDKFISVEMRKNIFRGKNLGGVVTEEQYQNIANGTFKGFFIGDYWETERNRWRIADINYWLGIGDQKCTTNHLVIVPDLTATNDDGEEMKSGYVSTDGLTYNYMRNVLLNKVSLYTGHLFDGHILNHRMKVTNHTSNGNVTSTVYVNSEVEFMGEMLLTGTYINAAFGSPVKGSSISRKDVTEYSQLKLFNLAKQYIPSNHSYWLSDLVSYSTNAYVNADGQISMADIETQINHRVVFGITG